MNESINQRISAFTDLFSVPKRSEPTKERKKTQRGEKGEEGNSS